MRLRRQAGCQVAANCGGPFPVVSSEESRLILAVVDVEGAVWTLLEGEEVERCFDKMLLNNSDFMYAKIVFEKR